MARRKAKKARRIRKRRDKDLIEKRVGDFAEELEALAKKYGKDMERKGTRYDSWFFSTFGILGPFISAIIGILILVLFTAILSVVNLPLGNAFIGNVSSFLTANTGLLFVIILYFSFTSYLSKVYPEEYRPLSPLFTAIGITTGFWIFMSAVRIANLSLGFSWLTLVAVWVEMNLLQIFAFFLFLGYLLYFIWLFLARARGENGVREMPRAARIRGGPKRLYRSGKEKILGGVCGGIAEYLDVDPVIIRLLWVIACLAWGAGIILYIIAWIIIPRNPDHKWKN